MKNLKEKLLNAKRVCIFRTDGIGDMILTLPMVNALKFINQEIEIHFIISERTYPLLRNQPNIKKVYFIEDIVKFPCFLKERNYDVAFFPRPKPKEVFAAFIAKIPLRVGSAYRFYSILLNHRVGEHRKYGKKSEAKHNLNLISSITNEEYDIKLLPPIIDINTLESIKTKFNLPTEFIIIHPGGAGSAPKLPIEKFIKIAKIITNKYRKRIVVTGNETEKYLAQSISTNVKNAIDLSGQLTLEELIALISLSNGVICNSTGVIHIAASLDKKIIGFYPNSPQVNSIRWGPVSNQKKILTPIYTSDLDKDNMDLISVETIENAFVELFVLVIT